MFVSVEKCNFATEKDKRKMKSQILTYSLSNILLNAIIIIRLPEVAGSDET